MKHQCVGNDIIDVSRIEKKGRCCIAIKPISKGFAVSSNIAFTWTARSVYIDTLCSNCLRPSSSLKRCTICQAVQYCDKVCQKNDWVQHKHECKHISGLLSKLSEQDFDDAKLLIRTIMYMNTPKTSALCTISDNTVHCCKEHVISLSIPSVCYDESLLAVLSVVCSITKQPMEYVANMLFQFRSNNFGITNELMTCVGAGVYPHAAILNHSCIPNCVLRYSLASTGPVLHIVALRDIAVGEELTHSYVDCTQPRVMRQLTLSEHYDFTCDCSLCAGGRSVAGATTILKTEMQQFLNDYSSVELDPLTIREFLMSFFKRHQPTVHTPLKCDPLITEIRVTTDEFVSITEEVEALVSRAQEKDLLNEETSSSITPDSETALSLLESALSRLQPACGPFNFELYKLRGRLMTQYLMSGSSPGDALVQCRCMVAYLTVALSHIPCHPLLGLQLFTLGDIARDVGELQYALEVYEWAVSILNVTHGKESEMVHRLEMSILEINSDLIHLR